MQEEIEISPSEEQLYKEIETYRRRVIFVVSLAAAVVLIVGALRLFSFFQSHFYLYGRFYSNSVSSIDLRGRHLTLAKYNQLLSEHPQCRILWDIPFHGSYYSAQTKWLTVDSLSESDLELLAFLPELERITITNDLNPDLLMRLRELLPLCTIISSVDLSDSVFSDEDVENLEVSSKQLDILENRMEQLTNLKTVHINGELPSASRLQALELLYPDIVFLWDVDILGTVFSNHEERIDLSGFALREVPNLSEVLRLLTHLKTLFLLDTDLTDEQITLLEVQLPDIAIIREWKLGTRIVSPSAEEVDLSGTEVDLELLEKQITEMPNLKKVIMCGCGISDQEMAALNARHEGIQFVWEVTIKNITIRTDAETFVPRLYKVTLTDKDISALQYCTGMTAIDLGSMWNISDCSWAANMPNLKYLVIENTAVNDLSPLQSLKKLIFLDIGNLAVKDLSPLTGCTALEDLRLDECTAEPDPLAQMTWLKNVCWLGCTNTLRCSGRAPQVLSAALTGTNLVLYREDHQLQSWYTLDNYYKMCDLLNLPYYGQPGK